MGHVEMIFVIITMDFILKKEISFFMINIHSDVQIKKVITTK